MYLSASSSVAPTSRVSDGLGAAPHLVNRARRLNMDWTIEELEQIMHDGMADVECEVCGHCATVEPDGDYPCPECGEGRLVSPLILEGLI